MKRQPVQRKGFTTQELLEKAREFRGQHDFGGEGDAAISAFLHEALGISEPSEG